MLAASWPDTFRQPLCSISYSFPTTTRWSSSLRMPLVHSWPSSPCLCYSGWSAQVFCLSTSGLKPDSIILGLVVSPQRVLSPLTYNQIPLNPNFNEWHLTCFRNSSWSWRVMGKAEQWNLQWGRFCINWNIRTWRHSTSSKCGSPAQGITPGKTQTKPTFINVLLINLT